MDPFKHPVRLIDHPSNCTLPTPATEALTLGKPSELKTFEVSSEKSFDTNCDKVTAHLAQTAAHDHGRKLLENGWRGRINNLLDFDATAVEDGDYITIYVRDPEGAVTAWIVTAHIEPVYSAVPGAL